MKDIIVEVTGSITIVQMGQRIDFSNAKEYEEILLNVLAEGTQNLLLDLSHTNYMGSAGLRVLLILAKKLSKNNGFFALCEIHPSVFEVFEAGGFHKIFRIYKKREDAILDHLSPDI